jgi:hypothetical protein
MPAEIAKAETREVSPLKNVLERMGFPRVDDSARMVGKQQHGSWTMALLLGKITPV